VRHCPPARSPSEKLSQTLADREREVAEGFFGLLKRERVNRRRYETRAEARADVFDYIERFHNPRRARRTERRENDEVGLTQPSVEKG
jgi:putative transposase